MKLWFENAEGIRRIIKDPCNTWGEVNQAIQEFIDNCNVNKHKIAKEIYGKDYDPSKVVPFKSYYTRAWEEDGMTKLDVGSHTEFFYWEGKITAMTMKEDGEAEFEIE